MYYKLAKNNQLKDDMEEEKKGKQKKNTYVHIYAPLAFKFSYH